MRERGRSGISVARSTLRKTETCERTFRSRKIPEGVGFAAAAATTPQAQRLRDMIAR